MTWRALALVSVTLVLSLNASACSGDESASSDFATVHTETGPSKVLRESVTWFITARMNGIGIDEFLSPRCVDGERPSSNQDWLLPKRYSEEIDGNRAVVSYELPMVDDESTEPTWGGTIPQTDTLTQVSNEQWRLVDGRWLWDDCMSSASTSSEDPSITVDVEGFTEILEVTARQGTPVDDFQALADLVVPLDLSVRNFSVSLDPINKVLVVSGTGDVPETQITELTQQLEADPRIQRVDRIE
jgi:hypothetical protein